MVIVGLVHAGHVQARAQYVFDGWVLLDIALAVAPLASGLVTLVIQLRRPGATWRRAVVTASLIALAASVVSAGLAVFWV